jgi:hypothetical protein
MPTYKDQAGNTVVWNNAATRVEAQHFSSAVSASGMTSTNLASGIGSITFGTGSTDAAGDATVNFSSASNSAAAALARITFGTTYAAAPRVTIGPASSNWTTANFYVDSADTTATYFILRNLTALSGFSGAIKFSYVVCGQPGG